jgi:hypothetical protein
MRTGPQIFVDELERLLALPLQPQEALRHWYDEARNLQKAMQQHPEVEIPHEIWHFLFDADIRSKPDELEYRDAQERIVRDFIRTLRGQTSAP